MNNNSVEYSTKTDPNNNKYSFKSKEIKTFVEILTNKKTCFCINCEKPQVYMLETENVTLTIRNVTFTYEELTPICIVCGESMYVPEINDINYNRSLQAYEQEITKPSDK